MAEAVAINAQASLLLLLRQAGVLVALAASVALGLYVALWARTPEYTVLYADLPDRDVGEVVSQLQSQQVTYRLDPASGAILVAADQVHDARIKLAAAGLPRSAGLGVSMLTDEGGFGTSQFLEQARYQHAIEAELSRSIASISNVRAARVHLALPKQTAFARTRTPPSASVIVDLFSGRRLEPHQVGAIVHMVSASVAGLSPEQVTVIDQFGNLLTDGMGGADELALSAKRLEYTRTLEQRYIERVEAILAPLVGADGVRAQVTADVDFTATEQTRESYNPDLPAVRSESLLEEERSGAGGSGGVPGALSNEPPGPATAPEDTTAQADAAAATGAAADATTTAAAGPSNRRNQTTRNYELDRTISHTRPSVGNLRRVSVAVVVRNPVPATPVGEEAAGAGEPPAEEAAASENAEDAAAAEEGTAGAAAEAARSEFTPEELARMTDLVKDAIGFDAVRGDTVRVTATDFLTPPAPEPLPPTPLWEQPWVWSVGKQALGGLFALFILFGVIRPTVRNLMTKPLSVAAGPAELSHADGPRAALAGPGQEALPAPGAGGMVPALPSVQRSASGEPLLVSSDIDPNIDNVKQFVSQDPRVAAQVIKGWVGE